MNIFVELARILDHVWLYFTGFPMIRQSKVNDHLYVGSLYHDQGIERMKSLGISAIVDMRSTLIEKMESLKGFKVLQLPTVDRTPPTIDDLYKGAQFIDEEIKRGGIVYAHCRYGEGRGPSVAIAYLILSGKSFDEAYSEVKKVRCFIRPSVAQIDRLKEFEKLYGKH